MIKPNSFRNREFRQLLEDCETRGQSTRRRLSPFPSPHLFLEGPLMAKRVGREPLDKWKIQDAVETYGIRNWSKGYFGVNKHGHVTVHPNKKPDQAIDLKDLVDQLQARGIQLPI